MNANTGTSSHSVAECFGAPRRTHWPLRWVGGGCDSGGSKWREQVVGASGGSKDGLLQAQCNPRDITIARHTRHNHCALRATEARHLPCHTHASHIPAMSHTCLAHTSHICLSQDMALKMAHSRCNIRDCRPCERRRKGGGSGREKGGGREDQWQRRRCTLCAAVGVDGRGL